MAFVSISLQIDHPVLTDETPCPGLYCALIDAIWRTAMLVLSRKTAKNYTLRPSTVKSQESILATAEATKSLLRLMRRDHAVLCEKN